MSVDEKIPESVQGTIDAMHGKEDRALQSRVALFVVVALASGGATLTLFDSYAHRDAVAAMHYVILFPCGWGVAVFLFALALFRKKRKGPNQSTQPTLGG